MKETCTRVTEEFAVIISMLTRQHSVRWKEQLAEYGEPGRRKGILWRRLKAFVAEEEKERGKEDQKNSQTLSIFETLAKRSADKHLWAENWVIKSRNELHNLNQ